MSAILIAACLAGIIDPPPDERRIESLVRQLGSGIYAEREEAGKALKAIGPAALPSLREAGRSNDLELRTRTEGLIREITERDVSSPTLVPLNFRDRPLSDVLKSVGDQGRIDLELAQGIDGKQRITLESPEPLPFWQAYDKLCEQAFLVEGFAQPRPMNPNQPAPPAPPTLPLIEGYPRPERLRYHGQLRIRRLEADGGRAGMVMNANGQPGRPLVLEFRAEPGRSLVVTEPPQVLAAVDARGRNLVVQEEPRQNVAVANVAPPGGPFQKMEVIAAPPGQPQAASSIPMNPAFARITLSPPGDNPNAAQNFRGMMADPDGGRIPVKQLRVKVTVQVIAPGGDPKTIPLADALGRDIGDASLTLRINSILTDPFDQETIIKTALSPGPNQGANGVLPFVAGGPMQQAQIQNAQMQMMQYMRSMGRMSSLNLGFSLTPLEFLDANGQPMAATPTLTRLQGNRRDDRWQFPAKPDSVRLQGLNTHTETFEIEFNDFDL